MPSAQKTDFFVSCMPHQSMISMLRCAYVLDLQQRGFSILKEWLLFRIFSSLFWKGLIGFSIVSIFHRVVWLLALGNMTMQFTTTNTNFSISQVNKIHPFPFQFNNFASVPKERAAIFFCSIFCSIFCCTVGPAANLKVPVSNV